MYAVPIIAALLTSLISSVLSMAASTPHQMVRSRRLTENSVGKLVLEQMSDAQFRMIGRYIIMVIGW